MATFRCTMIFRYQTETGRPAGMSESWYKDGGTAESAMTSLLDICDPRARMLPDGCAIVGQRVQQIAPVGPSVTGNVRFPGARLQTIQDVPQMALQCKVQSAARARTKGFSMRMIADEDVIGGDLVILPALNTALRLFATRLVNNTMSWRARMLTARVRIVAVAADGTFEIEPGLTLAVNQYLTLLRVRNTAGRAVTGNYRISVATDNTHGRFSNWGGTQVANSGFVRLLAFEYPVPAPFPPNATIIQPIRSMVRKVGRPFDLYRGRASARR